MGKNREEKMMIKIRPEKQKDAETISDVNNSAFETKAEAVLLDYLRESGVLTLSLVAEDRGLVVGHIAFSPVTILSEETVHKSVGLGPMSVLPEYQRKGIGSRLVESGLFDLEKLGYKSVVVLGHPEYYPRFGFVPASRFALHIGEFSMQGRR